MTLRSEWTAKAVGNLHEHLSRVGYTTADCLIIADMIFDNAVDRARLIAMSGPSESEARLLASALPAVDLGRLLVPTTVAAGVLSATRTALLRYRQDGKLVPALTHRSSRGTRDELLAYWIGDLIEVLADDHAQERHPGQGVRRFPE